MSRVGVITISYNADPEPLFNSIKSARHAIRSYVFVHGQDPKVRGKLDTIVRDRDVCYFPYGVNRGVARSWNEGLHASLRDRNDVTIIVNDDLFFYDGAFDEFVDFILSTGERRPDFGAVTTFGLETGTAEGVGSSQFYLKPNWQGGACMAIGRKAVDTIGYFDQNFWPAYYEDADYFRRLELSGLPILWDERTLLEHDRSFSLRADPFLRRLHAARHRRNELYYQRKWGGLRQWGGPDALPGEENLDHPFGEERFGYRIPFETIEAPYGLPFDRNDLGQARSLGVLEDSLSEELLSILVRYAPNAGRLLEWGCGETTAVLAGFGQAHAAKLVLSIDHSADAVRKLMRDLPRYPFLHMRRIDPEKLVDTEGELDVAYAAYPTLLGLTFDVVVIGGRWRMECALAANAVLAPGGIVLLHGWRRPRYHAVREIFDVVEEGREFLVLRGKKNA